MTRRRHHKLCKGVQAKSCNPAMRRAGEREGNPSHPKQKECAEGPPLGYVRAVVNPDVPSRPLPSSVDGLAVSIASGALDVAERAALIEGMPLILMDDGSYDLHLNRFFRACLGMGAHSPNT
ncbi:MAG TPA: hypothetical protein VNK51_22330 [Bradyrhizobium sp.]|nr:hypothetical protein [Bradyrhizobium sp.]